MSCIYSGITNTITKVVDSNNSVASDELTAALKKAKIISIAMMATAVALFILGCVLITTGGIALIFVSLPLFYFGYNSFKVAEALDEFPSKLKDYKFKQNGDSASYVLDEDKLKADLYARTICYEWAIDGFVAHLGDTIEDKKQQPGS